MIDSIIAGTGNSRYLRSSIPAGTTWDDVLTMLRAGTFPIDLAGINAAGFTTVGTALTAATLLKAAVCTALGLSSDATPSDAWEVIITRISEKQDAPSTAGTAGQVLGLDNSLNPVWVDQSGGGGGTTEVAWFTYGTSTSAQIESAFQAGKICMAVNGSRIFVLGIHASSTSHTFFSATYGTVYQIKCDNDTWTNNSRSIPVAATETPANLGTAAVGSSAKYAKEDHVHETEVAWFTYGTSTSAQIEAAYQAGKVCLATRSGYSQVFILSDRISATDHVFAAGTVTRMYILECDNGTWSSGSRLIPAGSNNTPEPLGTAAAGDGTTYARSNHVHAMPSASDVGAVAVAQGVAHAGEFVVVGSDGNVTTVTLATWQGGSY